MGCVVLHDIPCDGFNLDHVVIGPRAIYAVETKSVRKPRKTEANDHFKVTYDGEALRFPGFISHAPLVQTKRQAQWLSAYLQRVTNLTVPVIATISLPGWWIDPLKSQKNSDAVRVFNPSGRGAHFMADERGARTLDAGTSALITQALVMRYPIEG
jgi:hypothetical protein